MSFSVEEDLEDEFHGGEEEFVEAEEEVDFVFVAAEEVSEVKVCRKEGDGGDLAVVLDVG